MTAPSVNYAKVSNAASGAANDLGTLVRHAASWLQHDMKAYSRTTVEAAALFAGGAAAALVGSIILCVAAAYCILAVAPGTPPWIAFTVVGAPVFLLGVIVVIKGQQKLSTLEPLHQSSARMVQDVNQMADHLQETLDSARRAANETVESVKESVENIKQSVDVRHHVENHPWAMVAGATAMGYVGGVLLKSAAPATHVHSYHPAPGPYSGTGQGFPGGQHPEKPAEPSLHEGIMSKLGEVLGPEMQVLREIAIGMMFSVLRDAVSNAVPKNVEQPISEMFNGAALRFGGRPLPRGQASSPRPNN